MKFYLSLLVLCLLVSACGFSGKQKASEEKSKDQSSKSDSNKIAKTMEHEREKGGAGSLESSDNETPTYTIISSDDNKTRATLNVYIYNPTESEIIKLNDYLYSKYKKGSDAVLINYFDDKKIGENYFSNQMNSKISTKEKEDQFSHYIYNFKYIPSGHKALFKNSDGNWKEVKSY